MRYYLILKDVVFANYADDNTIYAADDNIDPSILFLQESSKKIWKWFSNNQIKGIIHDKCHLIVDTDDAAEIQIRDSVKKLINHEKLLGLKIGSELNFDGHVKSHAKKQC